MTPPTKPSMRTAGYSPAWMYGRKWATLELGCSASHQICRAKQTKIIIPKRAAIWLALATQGKSVLPLGCWRDFPDVPLDIHTWSEHGKPQNSNAPTFIRRTYCKATRYPYLSTCKCRNVISHWMVAKCKICTLQYFVYIRPRCTVVKSLSSSTSISYRAAFTFCRPQKSSLTK